MSIQFKHMNLLDSEAQYICHQVNCQGKMKSGVAKAIREKYPNVFSNYAELYGNTEDNKYLLGLIQIIALYDKYSKEELNQCCINMFAQYNSGYSTIQRYTSYEAFAMCLEKIAKTVEKGSTIAFPYKVGCDRGGANWNIIYTMIKEILGNDYDITFCYLQADDWIKNNTEREVEFQAWD